MSKREGRLFPEQALSILGSVPHVRLDELPTPGSAAGKDEVLVGRIRRDAAGSDNALAVWAVNDNLRKGAALNAIQIAELVVGARHVPV
jgi:aspartate-semialdehyde dehydrogenase